MKNIDSLLRTIGTSDVEMYLNMHGWQRLPATYASEYIFYEAPIRDDFGKQIKVAVPVTQDNTIVSEAVPQIIKTVALVERRDRYAIAADMSPANVDVFSVRIVSAVTRSSIGLQNAQWMYRALYGLFVASASAEINPAPWHRYANQLGTEYAAGLRLMPAETRSFAFAVRSNLGDETLTNHFANNRNRAASFKRNVMTRVMRGLYRCRAASDADATWDGLREEFKSGMNSNMCDAVVRMYQEVAAPDTEIEFGVEWSPKQGVPDDVRDIGTVTYTEKVITFTNQLGRVFRKEPEAPRVDVIGYVIALRDKTAEEQPQLLFGYDEDNEEPEAVADAFDKDRVVTLKVENAVNSGGINFNVVRMSLDNDRYAIACDAHNPKTKFAVRAKGRLVRRGRNYVLDPCEYFDKLPD